MLASACHCTVTFCCPPGTSVGGSSCTLSRAIWSPKLVAPSGTAAPLTTTSPTLQDVAHGRNQPQESRSPPRETITPYVPCAVAKSAAGWSVNSQSSTPLPLTRPGNAPACGRSWGGQLTSSSHAPPSAVMRTGRPWGRMGGRAGKSTVATVCHAKARLKGGAKATWMSAVATGG